jgi:hypothetical protein
VIVEWEGFYFRLPTIFGKQGLWSSGYDAALTRQISPVQIRAGPFSLLGQASGGNAFPYFRLQLKRPKTLAKNTQVCTSVLLFPLALFLKGPFR